MAVEFHYLRANRVCGPCSLEELVVHIQDGVLSANDLVKSNSDDRWIPAATIKGLFHMAGRQYLLAQWEQERQHPDGADSCDSAEFDEIRAESIARSQEDDVAHQPALEVETVQSAGSQTEIQQREQEALEEQRTRERLDFALAAANELKNEKHPERRRGPIRRILSKLFSIWFT